MNEQSEIEKQNIEALIAKGKEEVESLLELSEMGFFSEGERYSFEQITGEGNWEHLPETQRAEFIKGMGTILGVQILNYGESDVIRREFQEGVTGERTEKGAEATVLKTKYPQFEVHVVDYRNPDIPRHYDIVRVG